ncbi:MAG: hypothetical protein GKS03_04355 [Alphaproteobacteria bacterium]|nr:hypothetical protein [Alphaproteobacteria bacterium]
MSVNTPSFQAPECRGFYEHWQSLPKNGLAPTSETFLDAAHPVYAPSVYILEFSDSDIIIRLMGTALVERWKKDRTGECFLTTQDSEVKKVFVINSSQIVNIPCGLRATNQFLLSTGQRVSTEAIALPLTAAHGRPLRFVSYSHMFEKPADDEKVGGWEDVVDQEWINLGAGVPERFLVRQKK